jgi:hypothetical protein
MEAAAGVQHASAKARSLPVAESKTNIKDKLRVTVTGTRDNKIASNYQ